MGKFSDFIKQFDIFGRPVSLTYQGETEYRTVFGSVVTLICYSIMAFFIYLRTTLLVQFDEPFFSMVAEDQPETEGFSLVGQTDGKNYDFNFAIEQPSTSIGTLKMRKHVLRNQEEV